jgi:thioredoxin-related protein
MPRAAVGFWLVVVVAVELGSAGAAAAQEVRWRQDYAAARKEAAASGRPLLLDFGNEGCVWCRKLDATTFRDRAVVELLNERFIPVKVDGDREEWLTRAAAVNAFPTLVILSADGKIVGRHEGYADAAKMTTLLKQAAPAEAPKPAAAPVAAARTPAAELLTAARADHAAGRYLACIERCDRLISAFAASPEAGEARRLSAGITADPVKWRQVTGQLETDLTALQQNLGAALGR